jgi:hypothetical protein
MDITQRERERVRESEREDELERESKRVKWPRQSSPPNLKGSIYRWWRWWFIFITTVDMRIT